MMESVISWFQQEAKHRTHGKKREEKTMKLMKKIIAVILVVAMLGISAVAYAAGSFVKFTGNATCYKKAGSAATDTVIRRGSVAEKLDTKGSYTKVRLDKNTTMWVKTKYVSADKKATKSKIAYSSGGSKHSEAGKAKSVSGYRKVVAKGNCNIRKNACLDSKSYGTFHKGESMKFTGKVSRDSRGIDWYSVVTAKGTKAWVSSVYCKLVK